MGPQKGRGLLSSCCARSRPLGPATAFPDRQMKCWKASLKSFASYLKALGMRPYRPADLALISCWMLPRGEVRLQGQAVEKAAQSRAALRAAPDHVYSLTLAAFKTTGAKKSSFNSSCQTDLIFFCRWCFPATSPALSLIYAGVHLIKRWFLPTANIHRCCTQAKMLKFSAQAFISQGP